MKKTIVALAVLLATGTVSYAQGGFQMPSPEERVKRMHAKLDSAFKPDEAKAKQVDDLYLEFYKTQDKVRQELVESNGGNFQGMREQMQEKMKPHQEALDAKLKPILGDDNFKIWKEQIEPTLRGRGGPPRNR
ncbi:MAG TPA: hypothetical protein VFP97_03480 [Chitinophagaceae bacterium]|nr:hypothetical protein [Chitinophagaceae bacterium]